MKRYKLGQRRTKTDAHGNSATMPDMIECENGEYIKYSEYEQLLESIGAGGVSGQMVTRGASAKPVANDLGPIRVGRLPTMNQDEYPGLGAWWVQLRVGSEFDEVLARVYGETPEQAHARAVALAAPVATQAQPDIRFLLKDPVVVHNNMCRGIIAPITFDMLAHVLGDDAKQEWLTAQAQQPVSGADDGLPPIPSAYNERGAYIGYSKSDLIPYARAALAQQDADKVDAERYRLLRRGQHWSVINGIGDALRADELDAAIDAARKEQIK